MCHISMHFRESMADLVIQIIKSGCCFIMHSLEHNVVIAGYKNQILEPRHHLVACFIQRQSKFCLIVLVMTWSSQVSPLPRSSIQVSTFAFPAVSSQSDASLVFPILKTRLLSFGTKCSCHYKSGKTPGPVDTDMQEHSLALNSQDSSMTGVYSLLLYPPERNGWALELNYKCQSAKIPGA